MVEDRKIKMDQPIKLRDGLTDKDIVHPLQVAQTFVNISNQHFYEKERLRSELEAANWKLEGYRQYYDKLRNDQIDLLRHFEYVAIRLIARINDDNEIKQVLNDNEFD